MKMFPKNFLCETLSTIGNPSHHSFVMISNTTGQGGDQPNPSCAL